MRVVRWVWPGFEPGHHEPLASAPTNVSSTRPLRSTSGYPLNSSRSTDNNEAIARSFDACFCEEACAGASDTSKGNEQEVICLNLRINI